MSQVLRQNLYAPEGSRDGTLTKDSHLYNGYAEKGETEGSIYVYKRPAFKLLRTGPAGTGLGVFNWNGSIYQVTNTALLKDGVSIGTVDASSMYQFSSCLGASPKLFLKNNTHAYTSDGVTVTAVSDVNYPTTTVPGAVYLDGTMYVMDAKANIHGSNFNDPTTWDPLNLIVAQIEPDPGIALMKQLVYVVAIKAQSTEVFYDAGNATGSPLAAVQGSKLGMGARTGASVAKLSDEFCFIGTSEEGSVQAMSMMRVHGEPISSHAVDRLLGAFDYSTIYSWGARFPGHRIYVVTSKVSNQTFVFDLSVGGWYIWTDANNNYVPIVAASHDNNYLPVLQHESNGCLYTMDLGTYMDGYGAGNIPVSVATPNYDSGNLCNKSNSRFALVADNIATSVSISWSDDDYQTFTTPQTININTQQAFVQDGSSFQRRAYLITHNDNTFLRLMGFEQILAQSAT